MMPVMDQITQAFVMGFFSSLMTVFPVCMLLLLPRDGWARGEVLENMKKRIDILEIMIEDRNKIIDGLLTESLEKEMESTYGKKPTSNEV